METRWIKFKALGSEVVMVAQLETSQYNLLEEAKKLTEDFEKKFSRFIRNNELDRFNNSSTSSFSVSKEFAELLSEAKKMHKETGGVFDPTIIDALETAGYDKNFSDLELNNREKVSASEVKTKFKKRGKFSALKISGTRIKKPAGLRLDFGGLGKGFLADKLANSHFKKVANCWISMGGDLFVKGSEKPDQKNGWKIGVEDPNQPGREIFTVMTGGKDLGIATSGVFKRRGLKGGFEWNHLIDTKTGLPVNNNIIAVTAISTSAKKADVFAKTVLMLGENKGFEFIEKQKDSAAVIFFKGGGAQFSKRATQYIRNT